MNSMLIAFAACLALTTAVHQGLVLQGPGSHAAVIGPDGSQISASEQGGAVVADQASGYAVHSAPILAHSLPVAHALPLARAIPVGHHILAHEGQYVPSGLERLYDDGSYRGEHHYAEHLHHLY